MYWIGLVAFTLPEECPGEGKNVQEYVFVYLQLLVYFLWVVMAAAMLLVSLRGEHAERRAFRGSSACTGDVFWLSPSQFFLTLQARPAYAACSLPLLP